MSVGNSGEAEIHIIVLRSTVWSSLSSFCGMKLLVSSVSGKKNRESEDIFEAQYLELL